MILLERSKDIETAIWFLVTERKKYIHFRMCDDWSGRLKLRELENVAHNDMDRWNLVMVCIGFAQHCCLSFNP